MIVSWFSKMALKETLSFSYFLKLSVNTSALLLRHLITTNLEIFREHQHSNKMAMIYTFMHSFSISYKCTPYFSPSSKVRVLKPWCMMYREGSGQYVPAQSSKLKESMHYFLTVLFKQILPSYTTGYDPDHRLQKIKLLKFLNFLQQFRKWILFSSFHQGKKIQSANMRVLRLTCKTVTTIG